MKKYTINTPQVISEITTDETVVINLETGSYYNLNADASKIWALLEKGVDITDFEKIDASIIEFCNKLIAEGLLKEATTTEKVTTIDVDAKNLVLETYTDMQDLLGLDPIHEAAPEAGWPVAKNS
jgi:hypothetical protein